MPASFADFVAFAKAYPAKTYPKETYPKEAYPKCWPYGSRLARMWRRALLSTMGESNRDYAMRRGEA